MYHIYKITNLVNQKSYIGSSVRVEKRWQQHKTDAFNPNNENFKDYLLSKDIQVLSLPNPEDKNLVQHIYNLFSKYQNI